MLRSEACQRAYDEPSSDWNRHVTRDYLIVRLQSWWAEQPDEPWRLHHQGRSHFDGTKVAEHRNVLVQGGLIKDVGGSDIAAPRGIQEVDGRGRTLMPGLIDAHVHLSESVEADLRQALSLGVTTVFDMFNVSTRFDRIKALRTVDPADMADVRTAGIGASAPKGHPSIMGGPAFPTITSASEAEAFVGARVAEGSDYIKIIYDDLGAAGMSVPMLDYQTVKALVANAHARGKRAVVHVMSEQRAREAIEAGADGLAHLFVGPEVSPDFAELAASRGVFVIPTLGVLHGICGHPDGEAILGDPLLLQGSRNAASATARMGAPTIGSALSVSGGPKTPFSRNQKTPAKIDKKPKEVLCRKDYNICAASRRW